MRSLFAALLVLSCCATARAQEAAGEPSEPTPTEATASDATPTAPAAPSTTAAPAAPGWGAIVLSFGGDAAEGTNAEARDGATAALVAQGFSVLAEAEITARVPPARLRAAGSIDALRAIAVELGAESVVSVAVWTSGGVADSVIVSIAPARVPEGEPTRSYSATESVGDAGLAAAAQAACLAALERRTRAALLGGGSGHVAVEEAPPDEEEEIVEDDPWAERPRNSEGDVESLFGIIGPGLLLAIGGTGLGLGVYAVLDENCQVRGPETNVCLQGDAPNVGLGVALMIGGVLAAGGAVIWWITGASTTNEPRIDGVAWHDGGMLRLRGRF